MNIFYDLLIFILAGLLIFKAADLFVAGAVEVSAALKLPKILIGTTIVSLLATLPELITSASASRSGNTGMSIGIGLGSYICNIGLVFAVASIICDINLKKEELYSKLALLLASLLAVYFISLDGLISRQDAVVLLILLAAFMYINYSTSKKHRLEIEKHVDSIKKGSDLNKGLWLLLFGGILTLILANYGLLGPGMNIANALHVPPILIGLTIMAIGTSLPVFFTAISSVMKGHGDLAAGSVIGANALNLLWVLSVAALIRPLAVDTQTLVINFPFAIFITLLMLYLGYVDGIYDRLKGFIILASYLAYTLILFVFVYR